MEDGSHSLHGPHWKERLNFAFRHLQTLASAKLPREWRLLLAIFAVLLLLEVLFSVQAWTYLVLILLGAAAALLLQQIADPTPLFWTAPSEAWDLIASNKARVNHVWLHRTQTLVRGMLASSRGCDGFATSEGFVLVNVDFSQVQVLITAQAAWGDLAEDRCDERYLKGCRMIRLLAAAWLLLAGLLVLAVLRRLEFGSILLAIVVTSAAGHAVGRGVERVVGSWNTLAIWREEREGINHITVEPFTLPRLLWFDGGQGFLVRRVGRLLD